MFRPINISLAPNLLPKDILIAVKYLLLPWTWLKWKRGGQIAKLESAFKNYFNVRESFSFSSGRACLSVILKALAIGEGDEVILQAYTCVVVPNAIIWAGARPVYADIDQSLNIDPGQLESKVTDKTRAIIVQHTFGYPADLAAIKQIADRRNLILIEDCAHSLGAKYNNQLVGTFGQAAFFSFGRDKVISSVAGGILITDDQELAGKIKKIRQSTDFQTRFKIFQDLFHPAAMAFIIPWYNFLGLGKLILFIFQKIKLLNKVYSRSEKKYEMPADLVTRLPNSLAEIALNQFNYLQKFNARRRTVAEVYRQSLNNFKAQMINNNSEPVYLRYTLLDKNARNILKEARKNVLILGDWYDHVISPAWVDLTRVDYQKGSCPNAEKFVQESFNLPTYINISQKEINKIIEFLKRYES